MTWLDLHRHDKSNILYKKVTDSIELYTNKNKPKKKIEFKDKGMFF